MTLTELVDRVALQDKGQLNNNIERMGWKHRSSRIQSRTLGGSRGSLAAHSSGLMHYNV